MRGLRRWKEEVKVRLIAEKLRLVLLLNGPLEVKGGSLVGHWLVTGWSLAVRAIEEKPPG